MRGSNITTNAAVGPEIQKLEPPVRAMIKPATIAVYSPYWGGTPLAIARAMASGTATMPTVTPDSRSLRKSDNR